MFSENSSPKVIKAVCFVSIMVVYLGNFAIYLAKISFCCFAKCILWNFPYFPTKFIYFIVKCTSILYYVCVLSNHCIKLNFMPFVCLLSKLFILWHFHFKMSNFMLYLMFGILAQHQMCFASRNSHSLWVVFLWLVHHQKVVQFCNQSSIFLLRKIRH